MARSRRPAAAAGGGRRRRYSCTASGRATVGCMCSCICTTPRAQTQSRTCKEGGGREAWRGARGVRWARLRVGGCHARDDERAQLLPRQLDGHLAGHVVVMPQQRAHVDPDAAVCNHPPGGPHVLGGVVRGVDEEEGHQRLPRRLRVAVHLPPRPRLTLPARLGAVAVQQRSGRQGGRGGV